LLVLVFVPTAARADWLGIWADTPLTTAQEVRKLAINPAKIGCPVKLTGVVTHFNPDTNDFWLQDATAGIHVRQIPEAARLTQGDRVEVVGVSDTGAFSPCVIASKVAKLGRGTLPEPIVCNLLVDESRWQDGQWVQATVVVRGAYTQQGTTRIEVYTPRGCGLLVIPGEEWALPAKQLRQAEITVRGVCVATCKDKMVSGAPKILLASLPKMSETSPGSDGGNIPLRVIEQLLRFTPTSQTGGWQAKIAGVVTATPLPGVFIVQDTSGGATVWTENPRTDISVGTRVEVVGLLRIDEQRVGLTRASIKALGPGILPQAVTTHSYQLIDRTRDAIVVKVSARVEEVREVHAFREWTAITLSDAAYRFDAYIPGTPQQNGLAKLERGSRVEITGVPVDATPEGKPSAGPSLFLPGAEAVSILELPPKVEPSVNQSWWTTTKVAYLIGGFLALVLVGGTWVLTLRMRVRRAAKEIEQQYEEKAKLEKQLHQATKLEAMGKLTGGIAHDFNNLLTVINGCSELLAEEVGERGRLADLTNDIRRAGERAAALTGQLLTFSRKRDIRISAVSVNEVVTDTARLLARVIGEHIRIETSLAQNLPPVQAEPGSLHQVIMNLAVNARDAMPRGGTLSLTTMFVIDAGEAGPGPEVPVGSGPKKYVRLIVSDTGTGMSEEVKARVFEPFFTTKEIGKGTGLGLATVYGVVQSLSGRIHVESEVGKGTTFQIDLRVHGEPISNADMTPLPGRSLKAVEAPPPPVRLSGTTVLVVEDNDLVREVLVVGLTTDGATVIAASQPEEALKILAEHSETIHVLITDMVMPGMSGRELADKVRAERPGMRIVFMSGYAADDVLREGVLEDQVEFIQKPFTPDHLTERLMRVLGRNG
jgi:signal transduction histidine kinase